MGAAVKPDVNFRMTCNVCGGRGWVDAIATQGKHAGGHMHVKCSSCNGTGRVQIGVK
jgi:DnaJ-class molecular chaperone